MGREKTLLRAAGCCLRTWRIAAASGLAFCLLSQIFDLRLLLTGAIFVIASLVGAAGIRLLGIKLTRGLQFLAFSGAIGLGVLLCIFSFMALCDLFGFWHLVVALVALCGSAIAVLRLQCGPGEFARFFAKMKSQETMLAFHVLLISVLLYVCFSNCNCPPYAFDETEYHLAYARTIAQHAGFVNDLDLRFPFFVHALHVGYAAVLVLTGDDVLVHYLSGLFLFLMSVGVFSVAHEKDGNAVAVLLLPFLLLFRELIIATSWAYLDLGLASFSTFAFLSFCKMGDERRQVVLAAFFAGVCVSIKYQGLATWGLLSAMVAIRGIVCRRNRDTAVFLAISVLVGCVWYVHNAIVAGNPMTPFLGKFFGYWPWSEQDIVGQAQDLSRGASGLLGIVQLPYNILIRPDRLFEPVPRVSFGISLLSVFLCFFLRGMHRTMSWAVPLAIVLWSVTSPYTRYAYAIFPFAAWQAAYVAVWMVERLLRHRRAVEVCVLLSFVCVFAKELSQLAPTCKDRTEFLSTMFAFGRPVVWLNQNAPDAVVYQVGSEAMHYCYCGRTRGDWFGPARYSDFLAVCNDESMLVKYIKKVGAQYLFLKKGLSWADFGVLRGYDDLLSIVYEDESYVIFRVKERADKDGDNSAQ